MKVLFFGTFEAAYERNRSLLDAMEYAGIDVELCHVPLLDKRNKISGLRDPVALARLGIRAARSYRRLVSRYLQAGRHDLVLVGYLGHVDVMLARALTSLRGTPVVFDAFISLSDTLVDDRGVFGSESTMAAVLEFIDRRSCRSADLVLLDTHSHIDFFVENFGLARDRFHRVPVSADPTVFEPAEAAERTPFTVFFYGKFAPLHGLEVIFDAADRLRGEAIDFLIVGTGQLDELVQARAAQLDRVQLRDWMEPEDLRETIGRSGACLGVFGLSGKASRVVPNKVYQCLAVGAPVITADSPGIREVLENERNALLIPAGDGAALAAAILRLRSDQALRDRLRREGRRAFESSASLPVVARELEAAFRRVLEAG